MNLSITRSEFLTKIATIVLAIICYVAHFHLNDGRMIFYCCLGFCGILIMRTIKHKYLLLLSVFISSYIVLLYPYFLNNLRIGTFTDLNQEALYQKTIYLFSVFLASLVFFFKEIPHVPIVSRLPVYDNNLIFYLNLLIMTGVLVFGASGQSIVEAGYGSNKATISIVYIYFPIFFLAAYISSGRKMFRIILMLVVGFAFIGKSLMFGGRGSTISMLLILFMLFFEHRISLPVLLVLALFGFAFFSFWGTFRAHPSLSAINFSELFSFSVSNRDKYTAVGNNQTDVFYASVRIITMVDVGLIDATKRIQAFGLFASSVFVPYSFLPPLANLASYRLEVYSSLGGGLIFAYFYVFLSYFGLIFIAKVINIIWVKIRTSTNKYTLTYCMLVVATINGWFAYNPITMFKLCLWGVIYIYVLDVIGGWLINRKA